MAIRIKSTVKVEASGSAAISQAHSMEVEAYGTIEVTVAAASSSNVQIQPGGAGQLLLLLISASNYTAGVTYEVDGSGTSVALDTPQMYLGAGSVALLGAVNAIVFTNPHAEDVDITVIIGRDATPP